MAGESNRGAWPGWVLVVPLIVVGVASARWLAGIMPACVFFAETGFLCPGCGATRSALALAEGRWGDALRNNVLFVIGVVCGGLWILLSALGERFPKVECLGVFRFRLWFLWLVLGGVMLFGVVRNLPGLEWLTPSAPFSLK